jgi:hypothetical protein
MKASLMKCENELVIKPEVKNADLLVQQVGVGG